MHINLWKFLGSEKQMAMENLQQKMKPMFVLLKCKYGKYEISHLIEHYLVINLTSS